MSTCSIVVVVVVVVLLLDIVVVLLLLLHNILATRPALALLLRVRASLRDHRRPPNLVSMLTPP